MLDTQVLAFTGIAALLTITPGADTMLVIRSVLGRGQRAGFLTAFGICCGLFVHATLSAIGLSLILVRSAAAFEIVKFAGVAYLVWLGAQSLSRGMRGAEHASTLLGPTPAQRSRTRAFMEGLLTNVLNPKVAIFYVAFLPQFITPDDAVFAMSILLAAIHFVLGIVWLSLVSVMLGRLRAVLTKPVVQRRLEACTGAILIAFGVRLAMERR